MRHYFGTDGIRAKVNTNPMTAEFVLRLGQAAGHVLTRDCVHTPHVLIGKDTRLSGYMIESALCAGLTAQGINVLLVGPVPTPAVAYLTRSLRADAGVMLSASHNPAGDNGIKFFAADGYKLPDQTELAIEQFIDDLPPLPPALEIGKALRIDDARGRYIEFLKASLPRGLRFDGLKIVVDCANGAAYDVAPNLFRELGADVVIMHAEPTGYNINQDCGSTYPQHMAEKVVAEHADVGFALDGDADRLIACDAEGVIIDGDRVMAILAMHLHQHGRLKGDAVVATSMSNLGFEHYLQQQGLQLHRADVGDRYVLEMMRAKGCNVGGEQSGHMILLDQNTTGDGLMTALQILCAMCDADKPLSALCDDMNLLPQKLWNIVLPERVNVMANKAVAARVATATAALGDRGRINVRMSGTEPKLRIMIEAEDEAEMQALGTSLSAEIPNLLGF